MTVAEVAELLRLNQQTIRNWIDAGRLPAVRLGRRVRIRQSDLDALVGAHTPAEPQTESTTVDDATVVDRVPNGQQSAERERTLDELRSSSSGFETSESGASTTA